MLGQYHIDMYVQLIRRSNISTLSVPDEGYSRIASCALNLISTRFFISFSYSLFCSENTIFRVPYAFNWVFSLKKMISFHFYSYLAFYYFYISPQKHSFQKVDIFLSCGKDLHRSFISLREEIKLVLPSHLFNFLK